MKHSNLIGIDISDASIKVLELNDAHEVIAYGSIELPTGIITDGMVVDIAGFTKKVDELLVATEPQVLRTDDTILRAILCLPESKLFTHYVTIPSTVKRSEYPEYIRTEAEKMIPFDFAELYFDHHVVSTHETLGAVFCGCAKRMCR